MKMPGAKRHISDKKVRGKQRQKIQSGWLTVLEQLIRNRLFWLFALFFAGVWLFAAIAKEVRDNETLHVDEWVLRQVHHAVRPGLDGVVTVVTQLGGVVVVPLVCLGVALFIYQKGTREHAWLVLAGVIGSSLLNLILKLLFARSRPDLWDHLVTERSFSFPSGHAMASMSLAASVVAVLWSSRWRTAVISLGIVYITVIGFTRLYLGVHYPTDIVAGWVISLGWVALVWLVYYRRGVRSKE